MDFKKLFMNNKAVSPVIGVVLMVAITVILAAAIGSSVFGQGTSEPAPQANLDIQSISISSTTPATPATVRFEHLGGDPINFDATLTKVTVSVDGATSVTVDPTVVSDNLSVLSVGDIKTLNLGNTSSPISVASGNTVKIKIVDIKTSQLICDKDIRF